MNPPRLLRTSAFRLALLFAGVSLVCVLLLFAFIEWYTVDSLRDRLRDTVSTRLSAIIEDYQAATEPGLARNVDNLAEQNLGSYTLLQDGNGRKLAGNLPARPLRPGWSTIDLLPNPEQGHSETHPLIARTMRLPQGGELLVAQDAFPLEELAELIARAFAVGTVAVLVLSLAGGFALSRRVLRRLTAIGHAGQDIMHGDLSRRLPLRGTGDELDQLVAVFNALLDRVEEFMNAMRQVTNDIAHDLRTPLSRIRTRLEQLRRVARSAPEYETAIDRTLADTETLLEIFAALLRIAQIEFAAGAQQDDVDARWLIDTAVELYLPLTEERGQFLTSQAEPAIIRGDRELLVQMLANLIENASRHTPAGSRIEVGARRDGSRVLLWVEDNGPGIPEAERERVLRRFYRMEASRTTPGSGLGLSLAAAVAARLGGEIRLRDAGPGLRVKVWLPFGSSPLGR